MKVLESMGGCDVIEERHYDSSARYFVLDADGDVYHYQPAGTPDKVIPKARTKGNRGPNDAFPRIRARKGEMKKLFHSKLRPLGKPNNSNIETPQDKALEAQIGHEIAAYYKDTTYKPSLSSDGFFETVK
jgi:hypothetical protein